MDIGNFIWIIALFLFIHYKTNKLMETLDQLAADVASNKSVVDSAVTLLTGLKGKLDAAGTDPAKLKELSDSLESSTKSLADAVAANTPAETVPA